MLFLAGVLLAGTALAEAAKKDTRMPMTIGMAVPLLEDLGSLAAMGKEERAAFIVAVALINKDPNFSVTLAYKYEGKDTDTIVDTAKDAKVDSKGDLIYPVTNSVLSNEAYVSANYDSDLCKNARKVCDNADVKAIVGGVRSSRSIGVARCCATKTKLVQVSHASTSNYLKQTKTGGDGFPSFFRTVPNDDYQAKGLVALLEKYKITNVGMIYTNDAYAGGIAMGFKCLWLAKKYTFSPAVVDDCTNPTGKKDKDVWFPIDQGDAMASKDGVKQTYSYAEDAVRRIKEEGNSGVTLIFTVSHDSDEIMKHFESQGMTGQGWTYFGPDGPASAKLTGVNSHLEDAYAGFVGTNVKSGEKSTQTYIEWISQWEKFAADTDFVQITGVPWQHKDEAVANTFSPQVYDAVAAIAGGATSWYEKEDCTYKEGGSEAEVGCVITRQQLRDAMRHDNIEVIGIGNTVPCSDSGDYSAKVLGESQRCFKFDFDSGKSDGPISYEILNAVGDQWIDVGDYDEVDGLKFKHDIEWPGGKSTFAGDGRPKSAGVSDSDLPGWVVPVIVIISIGLVLLFIGLVVTIRKKTTVIGVGDAELGSLQ